MGYCANKVGCRHGSLTGNVGSEGCGDGGGDGGGSGGGDGGEKEPKGASGDGMVLKLCECQVQSPLLFVPTYSMHSNTATCRHFQFNR